MLAKLKPVAVPLAQRIRDIQAEASALIEKRATDLHDEHPGVPREWMLQQLNRGCPCRSALSLIEGD